MSAARRAALALCGLLLAGGCGYSAGIRLPEGTRTVGVEVFGNDSKLRDLEVELQEALADAVDRMVHAPLVDPRRADLVLRGRIVSYTQRGGIRSPQNERLETGVNIAIEVQLVRRGVPLPPGVEPGDAPAEPPTKRSDRNTTPATAADERVLRPLRLGQEFGFLLGEPLGEAQARRRTLQSLSDRVVLDLLGGIRSGGRL